MRKFKTILISMLSIGIACALFVVCVFALIDPKTMQISNSFTFTPNDVREEMKFTIKGTCKNCIQYNNAFREYEGGGTGCNKLEDYLKIKNLYYENSFDSTKPNVVSELETWDIGEVNFISTEEQDYISYWFEITNTSIETNLSISVEYLSNQDNNEFIYNEIYIYNSLSQSEDPVQYEDLIIPKATQGNEENNTKILEIRTICNTEDPFEKQDNNFKLIFEIVV